MKIDVFMWNQLWVIYCTLERYITVVCVQHEARQ